MSQNRRRQQAGRIATAGAVVGSVVAVAFGTGFAASRTVLGDGGTWLASGQTITHVNTATGQADATVDDDLVGDVGDQFVVRFEDGVAVVDRVDDTVTGIDQTDMTPLPPTAVDGADPTVAPPFAVAGETGFLVGDDSVTPVDPVSQQPIGAPVAVGAVAGSVVTAAGTLAVLDGATGALVEIGDGTASLPIQLSTEAPTGALVLSAVAGQPVVVDLEAGTVQRIVDGDPQPPIRVAGLAGADRDDIAVAAPDGDGDVLWVVQRNDRQLVGVDLARGSVRTGRLSDGDLRSPVVLAGLVYVPSGDAHRVSVIDARTLRVVDRHETAGTSRDVEVFVDEGRVWINDPAAPTALVVERDGITATTIDKGTGEEVEVEAPEVPETPPPAPEPDPEVPPVPAPAPPVTEVVVAPLPAPPTTEAAPPPTTPPPPPQTDVPGVTGLHVDDACARIQAAQLECVRQPVADAPAGTRRGTVLTQSPASGRVDVGQPVNLTFYDPTPIPVPDVTTMRVAEPTSGDPLLGEACLAITTAGLTCQPAVASAPAGQATPVDEVLTQNPVGGGTLDPGDPVTISFVTTTPMPSASGTADEFCTAVRDLNVSDCQVRAAGIGSSPGSVTGQAPAAGQAIDRTSVVVIDTPARRPVVPSVVGMAQADACNALQAETLRCTPVAAATVNRPGVAESQSVPPGDAEPGTEVVIGIPSGPDRDIYRFRAVNGPTSNQWALAVNDVPGTYDVYDELVSRPDAWQPNGTVGACYSTPVAGSWPLYDFIRSSSDPRHEDHFYGADDPGNSTNDQYVRGLTYYDQNRVLCWVAPTGMAGARQVVEYWEGSVSHFYTVDGNGPGGWATVGHWASWR